MTSGDPGAGPDGRRLGDQRVGRLLRWYPRAWRERYGDEFLAMVEDGLDGRPPGWRLRLAVVWAGLRERARQAVPAKLWRMAAEADPPPPMSWLGMVPAVISAVLFWSFQNLTVVAFSAGANRQARGAVPADAMVGLCVVVGVAVAVSGLAAGPALTRFLRAGGWPWIRRPVAVAAGGTAVAAAALTQLLLLARSMTLEQFPGSMAFLAWFIATIVPLGAALRFWRQAVVIMAGRLELRPRARTVQIMLNAVATSAAVAITPVGLIWTGLTGSMAWLIVPSGVYLLFSTGRSAPARLWWAWHRAQRLRAAGTGGR